MNRNEPTFLAAIVLLSSSSVVSATEAIDIGLRRELFVDRYLIARLDGVRLKLHRPQPQEVVLSLDRPWEKRGPGYVVVLQDGERYRMYYRALPDGEGKLDERQVTCVVESRDGIRWTRPHLGLFEFGRSKDNNICWRGAISHNVTPFIDTNPDCPADQKYKAVGGVKWTTGGLWALASPDGLRWRKLFDKPLPLAGNFDSQNVVFWDPMIGQYRGFWRDHRRKDPKIPDGRDVRVSTSPDLVKWSDRVWLDYDPGRDGTARAPADPRSANQFYTNGVQPYYRAPHILLGFPLRYIDRGWTASAESLPNRKRRKRLADLNVRGGRPTREGTAITDMLFMASRDGRRFHVWPEAIIPPGIQRSGSWFYGSSFKALGMVETPSKLDPAVSELSVFVSENTRQESPQRLRRYTFRMDGFASVHASLQGGELWTKPICFDGDRLQVNFATSAGGSLRVELQGADGKPFPGFALNDCHLQYGDQYDRTVSWKTGADVSGLRGKTVRMRIELKDADLYSFQFTTSKSGKK